MALYLLKRIESDCGYDQHEAAVIRAATEQEAREIAEKKLQSPKGAWTSASCEEITLTGKHGVVLGSFLAG